MRSEKESVLISGWFYVYLVETGTDTFTVILLTKPIYEGKYLILSNKLGIHVHVVDATTFTHPYLIGEVVAGDYKLMYGGLNIDKYNLRRCPPRGGGRREG